MNKYAKNLIVWVSAVLFTNLLTSCAGLGGSQKAKAVKEEDPVVLVSFEPEVNISRLWGSPIGRGLGTKYLKINPAVAGERIFVADAFGLVESRNRNDGKKIWQVRVGAPDSKGIFAFNERRDVSFLSGGVGVGEELVVVGTIHGEVIALNVDDGSEVWRARVSSEILAPPAIDGRLVVVQVGDGRIYALESDTGKTRWIYNSKVPILSLRGTASPRIDEGVVFAGFATGVVAAINADTGALLWETRVAQPEGISEIERIIDVDTSPLISNGIIYASSHQGATRAIRQVDGVVLWEVAAPSHLDLGEGYGNIYVITDDDRILAVDQRNARIVWEQDGLRNRELSSPLTYGNFLVVGDTFGYVHVLALSDGRFMARKKLSSQGIRSSLVQATGIVFIYTNSGGLYALEIRRT